MRRLIQAGRPGAAGAALALVLIACQPAAAPSPTAEPTSAPTIAPASALTTAAATPTTSGSVAQSATATALAVAATQTRAPRETAIMATVVAEIEQAIAAPTTGTPSAAGTPTLSPSQTALVATIVSRLEQVKAAPAMGTPSAAGTPIRSPAEATAAAATFEAVFAYPRQTDTPQPPTATPGPTGTSSANRAAPPPRPVTATPRPPRDAILTPVAPTQPIPGPTLAQLRRALLTEQDLGDRWTEFDSGDLKQRYPAVGISLDSDDDEILDVELHDARNGVPEFIALSLVEGESFESLTSASPPAHGTQGARYRYQRFEDGKRWYGEVVGWQRGNVVAAMRFESAKPDACVCEYGKRQDDKLAATIR